MTIENNRSSKITTTENKGESIITIVQVAHDFKMGKTDALNDLFMIKVYTKDMQRSHKCKGGIRDLVLHDDRINNLFNQYVTKTIKGIDYDNRFTLFYSALVHAFQTLQISDNEQDIYKHIQSTIKRSFDEEKKRIEAIEKEREQIELDRKNRLKKVRMKKKKELNKVYKVTLQKGISSDDFVNKINNILDKYKRKENAIIAEWWS